ncbi:YifB family Mg chelatase-like AAA ATPase [Fodinicurvata sp. EGI_FJ10296]|uniref:YifB family Mg chelatase-like AAA ATPase n=1 Tax=Fodinicurvata sp. EGI_FJ10296 TaxID=3231908 RepID=UPI003454A9F3
MVARISTVAFQGIDTRTIETQVQLSGGLPAFTIVGLPDKAVGESRERVRSALLAMGLSLPPKRITVNLAPADVAKEGSHFDLPIALGLLVATGVLAAEEMEEYVALGELGLDGTLRPVAGVLPAAIHANAMEKGFICPAFCGPEAVWAGDSGTGFEVLAPPTLLHLINHFKGTQVLSRPQPTPLDEAAADRGDLRDVKGQESAKRVLEIAAAGGHNLLMVGPPGAGKSMLASRLPGLLPETEPHEMLDLSRIHSVAGMLTDGKLVRHRPFRDPHHSASLPALVGGGSRVRPGEISLAHRGVLFLDELPEFSRQALESLRQPLETGQISIARANAHVTFPARVQLVAAMNPCRCGYLGDPGRACSRAPRCGQDYQAKVSGPILDRIDLHLEVPAVSAADLSLPPPQEGTAEVAARVRRARAIQTRRYAAHNQGPTASFVETNADADGQLLGNVATPDASGRALLADAADRFRLSARGWHRLLRVARTIADLDGSETVGRPHIAEALAYRNNAVAVA